MVLLRKWFPVLLFCVLAVRAPLFGQAAAINGQIEGTITDPTGAALPQAKVTIRNVDTDFSRVENTGESGFYRFAVLPLGSYEVTVEASGFGGVKRTGVVLNAGTTALVNITLNIANASQTVEVSSAPPITEPSRTDIGSTLSTNQVTNLPLLSRNPYNFILLQPNVSGRPNTEFGVPRKLNANGFNGRVNFQIDGNSNVQTDRAGIRLIPISNSFVGEIQQVNNGFAPEFGNTVGTVFNSITKSGTNAFHGEGAYIFRRTDFVSRPALLSDTAPKPIQNLDDLFVDVTGPIKKDKVFFFGAYEKAKRDIPSVVTVTASNVQALGLPTEFGNAIPFYQSLQFFLGKTDWQINDRNRLTLRFNGHRNDSPYNGGGALTLLSRTYNFVDRSYVGAAQFVSTPTSNLVFEIRGQAPYRSQQQLPFAATGTGPAITIPGIALFGGPTEVGFLFREVTPEVAGNVSYERGRHSLKAGITVRTVLDKKTNQVAATYTFPNVQAYLDAKSGTNLKNYTTFSQLLGDPSISYTSNFFSYYAQDTWKLRPNLTVIYGLRYDNYRLPEANQASVYEPSRSFRVDNNNFAPRLGVSWGLGKNQSTVIRASTGIFYDPPQTDVYFRSLLNNGAPQFFSVNTGPTAGFAPTFPNVFTSVPTGFNLPTQDVASVARDFATLYSYNANLSINQAITENLGIQVSYLYTRGNRLPVYRNLNLVPSGQFLADGRPIFSSTVRVDPRFNNILVAESVGQSSYNGGNITITRRFARGFELFGSYTLSHSIDDAPEQNNIDSGALLLSDPTNRKRDKANSLTDHRHVISASGVYQPDFRLSSRVARWLANGNRVSFTFAGGSGDLFNLGSNRTLNNDASLPTSLQRPLYIGRNTIRGPRIYALDARYSRLFPIRERMNAEFFAETTNLLNHTNVTALRSTATVDAAGNITAPINFGWTDARDQRLVQFGIKFNF